MVYYSDEQYAQLPLRIAAEDGGLDKEKATLNKLVGHGLEVSKASERAAADLKAAMENATTLRELRQQADEALRSTRMAVNREANENIAYDHDAGMDSINRHAQRSTYFMNAEDFGRRYLIPLLSVRKLEADADLLAALCSVKSQTALVAAIERYQASQALLEAEGYVEFSPNTGRTGALIAEAQQAFRDAREAMLAVTNERSRQKELRIGVFFEGVAQ